MAQSYMEKCVVCLNRGDTPFCGNCFRKAKKKKKSTAESRQKSNMDAIVKQMEKDKEKWLEQAHKNLADKKSSGTGVPEFDEMLKARYGEWLE